MKKTIFLMSATLAVPAFAGTAVLGGDATLTGATGATLAQNTGNYAQFASSGGASAVLDWSSFNVGVGKEMNFSGAGTTFFNLVDAAASKSQIDGIISGNGSVWVINPNGIAFGASSQINVGGLFAAAAGNISNAADLRSGAATAPAFSSFGGGVTTASGSRFTADQVALMGKTVSAAGDFTGVSGLTIGAADKLTVDEVAGGRISVSVADFAANPEETSVELGDLLVGDLDYGYFGGDLNVAAGNSVDVDGYVFAGGNVGVFTKNGDINISASGGIESIGIFGEVDLVSAMSAGGKGDINVDGFVGADGVYGLAYVYAGYGAGGVRSSGDLNVNGAIRSSTYAQLASFQGDATVGAGGIVAAVNGSLDLSAGNDVKIDGLVSAQGGLNVQSTGGSKGIEGSGELSSANAPLTLYAGGGDIAFAGKVTAGETLAVADGNVFLENGGNDFRGTFGAVGDAISARDANGIALGSMTAREGGIDVFTAAGDITVVEGANVAALNGDINLVSAMTADVSGNVTVNGDVNSGKSLRLFAGYGDSMGDASGNVTVNGYVRGKDAMYICAFDGSVTGSGDSLVDASGGTLSAQASNGDLNLAGAIAAKDASFVSVGGDVSVGHAQNNLEGTVFAAGENVKIANHANLKLGNVTASGNVDVNADGDVLVAQGFSVKGTGPNSEVSITSGNGGVSVVGDVLALGKGGSVSVTSASNKDGNGDIVISGGVVADGQVYVGAGYTPEGVRSGGKGGITLEQTGGVISYGDIAYLYAAGGNGKGLDVNGYVNGAGGVALASRDASGIYSSKGAARVVSGIVNESGDGLLVASPLRVQAVNGDADLNGIMMVAGDASISASGDVKAMNDNDFQGKVSAAGMSVELLDMNDLVLGDMFAVGGVRLNDKLEAEGYGVTVYADKLTVDKDATISVIGEGADLRLMSARGDVVIDGNLVTEGKLGRIGVNAARGATGGGNVLVNGNVEARGDDSTVELTAGSNEAVGNVVVDGTVKANGIVHLQAGRPGGGVTVNQGGTVGTVGEHTGVWIASGFLSEMANSDIDIKGTVFAEGDNSQVWIVTGGEEGGSGNVNVSGDVYVKGKEADLWIETGNKDNTVGGISISGTVRGEGEDAYVSVRTGLGTGAKGSLTVEDGGEVSISGKDATLVLGSAQGDSAQGDLTVDGRVVANGENTEIDVISGLGKRAEGNVNLAGDIVATGKDTAVLVWSGTGEESKGSVEVSGTINASGENARIGTLSSNGKSAQGSVNITGTVAANGKNSHARAYAGYGEGASGNLSVPGRVSANGDGSEALLVVGFGTDARGVADVSGSVTAVGNGANASIVGGFGKGATGSVRLNGVLRASNDVQVRVSGGPVVVTGGMMAGNVASAVASGGSISFGDTGVVLAGSTANVLADGDISQHGNAIEVNGGAAGVQDVSAAIKADTINLKAGGSIGGDGGYLGVDGKVRAVAGGDAYLAAASGTDFRGGDSAGAPSSVSVSGFERTVSSIDANGIVKEDKVVVDGIDANFSALGGTSAIVAGGDLSIYTSGKLEANGLLKAADDITVSASDLGDVSYLQAGGTLTINNVGNPSSPKIAYFESVNGKEPKINNQPNGTVIFIDGRLAGGNLRTLNQFGADEAFMVETPELKSTQGIFGSPTFLHGDLDVANPLAVGAIDYMLQETPRLTLDKSFPKEADQHVDSVVIPERDSIQFGRGAKDAAAASVDGKVTVSP